MLLREMNSPFVLFITHLCTNTAVKPEGSIVKFHLLYFLLNV